MSNLDPHSAFLDAAEYDEMRATTTGSYTGVGIEVSAEDGRVVVVTPIEGSPAARAGVRPGDVVLAVNERPVAADRLDDTIGRMRGVPGTQVKLAVGRDGRTRAAAVHARTRRSARALRAFGAAARRLRLRAHHAVQRLDA